MTAQFSIAPPSSANRRLARRTAHDGMLIAACWLVAATGLAGSYWLAPLALQAASGLAGLLGATAALLLIVSAKQR